MGLELAVGFGLRHEGTVLQSTDGGSADGYDAAAFGARAIQSFSCRGGEGVALAVQANVFDALDSERGKGAEADVES